MDNKPFVFISYSHEERNFTDRLIHDLVEAEINVWVDRTGLKPGTRSWEQVLRDAIRVVNAIVLIASPSSRRSNYVQGELDIADMYNCPVIPLWAVGEKWVDCIHIGRTQMQYIDARGDRYTAAIPTLVQTLIELSTATPHPESTSPLPEDFQPRNPYKGLRAFREEDRHDFFGRQDLIDSLIEKIDILPASGRMLTVVGPSGSGKSSLVMAGLLPRLRRNGLPGSENWIYLDPVIPGFHPMSNLAAVLSKTTLSQDENMLKLVLDHRDGYGLHSLALELAPRRDQRVVLFVDQFEEIFTHRVEEHERRQFIATLVNAATDPQGVTYVILTLRADFYGRPMQYLGLADLIQDHVPIFPMTLSELREIIEQPAQLPDVKLVFEEGLVGDLLFEVRDQPGGLPLLQFTLDQLFQRRDGQRLTLFAYQQIGGVRGALAYHAEETYQSLPSNKHRELCRPLFMRLIEPGITEQDTTRRRANWSELSLPNQEQTRVMHQVAETFTSARLLISGEVVGQATIEVSHEALIREWSRLADWVHTAREDIRFQHKLNADTVAWIERGKIPDDDQLYRDSLLNETLEWAGRNSPSVDEISFIRASAELQKRRVTKEATRRAQEARMARRARSYGCTAGVLAVIGIIALIMTVMATIQSLRAQQERRDAERLRTSAEEAQTPMIQNITQAASNLMELEQEVSTAQAQGTDAVEQAMIQITDVFRQVGQQQPPVGSLTSLRLSDAAERAYANGDKDIALSLAVQSALAGPSLGAAEQSLSAIAYQPGLRRFHTNINVRSVAISPDSMLVLVGTESGELMVWDLVSGTISEPWQAHNGPVMSIAFNPTGPPWQALSGSCDTPACADGDLAYWRVDTGEELWRSTGKMGGHAAVAFAPSSQSGDAPQALSGTCVTDNRICSYGMMVLWDVTNGSEVRRFELPTNSRVQSVAFSPDGTQAVSATMDFNLVLWDVQSGAQIREFEDYPGTEEISYTSDYGETLIVSDNELVITDNSGNETQRFKATFENILNGEPVPNMGTGQTYLQYEAGAYVVYDANTHEEMTRFESSQGRHPTAIFDPTGQFVISDGADYPIVIWDVEAGEVFGLLTGFHAPVTSLTVSSDGNRLVVGAADGSLHIRALDLLTAAEKYIENKARVFPTNTEFTFNEFFAPLYSVAIGHNGHTVLTGFSTGVAEWDLNPGGEIARQTFDISHVTERMFDAQAFDPDQNILAFGTCFDVNETTGNCLESKLVLWDTVGGGLNQRQIPGINGTVRRIVFSHDGSKLLIGSCCARDEEGATHAELLLWDVNAASELQRLSWPAADIDDIALNVDGTLALTGSCLTTECIQPEFIVWDLEEGTETHYSAPNDVIYRTHPGPQTAFTIEDVPVILAGNCKVGTDNPNSIEKLGISQLGMGQPIEYGQKVRATLPTGSEALWEFAGTAGDIVLLAAVAGDPVQMDMFLELFGPNAEQLTSDDDSGGEGDAAIMGFSLPVDGYYTIRVTSIAGGGDYTISLSKGLSTGPDLVVTPRQNETQQLNQPAQCQQAEVVLLDVANNRELTRFSWQTNDFYGASYVPDANMIFTQSCARFSSLETGPRCSEAELILWDAERGVRRRRFSSFEGEISTAMLNAEHRLALSVTTDGSLYLLSTITGEVLRYYNEPASPVEFAAFGYDPSVLFSFTVSAQAGTFDMITWRNDSLDELLSWTFANHVVEELTCEQREIYNVTPFCDVQGAFPTRTPYGIALTTPDPSTHDTSTPTQTMSISPIPSSPRDMATPTRTAVTDTPTAVQTTTPTLPPLATAVRINTAQSGVQHGNVPAGGSEAWTHEGRAGEVLTIVVSADNPADHASYGVRREQGLLDTFLVIRHPNGTILETMDDINTNFITDSTIWNLELPVEGTYQIEIYSWKESAGGGYTLTIESMLP